MWLTVVWTLCALCVAVVCNVVYQKIVNRHRPLPHVTIPIVGDLVNFIVRPNDWYMLRIRLYNGRARGYMWGQNIWLTGRADDIKSVVAMENKQVIGWAPDFIRELQGSGAITTMNGVQHMVVRKELFSLFSTYAMKEYFPSMRHFVHKEMAELASDKMLGAKVTMSPVFRRMAYAAVYGSFIDMDMAEDTEAVQLYETYIKGFTSLPMKVPGGGLVNGLKAHETLRQKIGMLVDEARMRVSQESHQKEEEVREKPIVRRGLVLDMLVKMQRDMEERGGEEGVLLDDLTLVDNLLITVIGGHETVLSTLCSLMKLLAEHPQAMEKVREEVMSICPDTDEPVTFEQINKLHYCMACIKETLRLVPPIHFGIKYVVEPFNLGPYTVPPGDLVFLLYEGPHETEFVDHDKFAPERFCKQSPEYKTTYATDDRKSFLSFSAGVRSCVGMKFALMEMQIVLAELMRNKLTWSLVPGQNLNLVLEGISVKYADGIQVIFNKTE